MSDLFQGDCKTGADTVVNTAPVSGWSEAVSVATMKPAIRGSESGMELPSSNRSMLLASMPCERPFTRTLRLRAQSRPWIAGYFRCRHRSQAGMPFAISSSFNFPTLTTPIASSIDNPTPNSSSTEITSFT